MKTRRQILSQATATLGSGLLSAHVLHAAELKRVGITVPGPGNLLFLPVTLAHKIGADASAGLDFDIRYVGGGPQAYKDMLDRNTDFSAGGLAALALQKLSGKPVVSIAPLSRVPAYVLLVRSALKGKVKTIADLKGRVVGVKGHVPGGRSTTQLFTEHMLALSGVRVESVNYVSVGQSYDSQHAALASGSVDAIMGDEPFATRMLEAKTAFVLADYHDLETTQKQMGGLFLNGNVATREDVASGQPELVAKVVAAMVQTLQWIVQHSETDIVTALDLQDPQERNALLAVMKKRKTMYSPDGRFSGSQIASVTRFLHATEQTPEAQKFDIQSLVNAKWAGTSP